MIIVYADKPFLSKTIANILLEKHPQEKIIYIHSLYFSNVYFDYPKNIKWKDFPYLQNTEFKIKDISNWMPLTLVDGKLVNIELSFEEVVNCEKIIFVGDPCSTDTYLFTNFLDIVFHKTIYDINIEAIVLNYLNEEQIVKSVYNTTKFSETVNFSVSFKELINQGKVKKYFDYNFNFNSFALLGKAYQHINNKFGNDKTPTTSFGNIFISKYMLQLLYYVRNQQQKNINYSCGKLIPEMIKWKGTGKYNFNTSIGNAASFSAILENLILLKLLIVNDKNVYITDKGIAFLEYLPKDCMDYDLPFRIELWSQLPFEDSKIKIDNYLTQYYKKIKNKLKDNL